MKLQEIFDMLAEGELSMLSMGGEEQGVINDTVYPSIVRHVNLGLLTLFRRFNLREDSFLLDIQPGQTRYKLKSQFAVTGKSKEPVRYIRDSTAQPFKDDLLKVEVVETPKRVPLVLNDRSNPLSVLTPSTFELQLPQDVADQKPSLPDELKTSTLVVHYRAKHPEIKIPLGYFDPARVEVELPPAYLQALLYFIASRVHTPRGLTNETEVGNIWFGKFEAECQRLELENLEIDQGIENTRLIRGGWV